MAPQALAATSCYPNITANDVQYSMRFYSDGLGFEVKDRHESEGVLRYVTPE